MSLVKLVLMPSLKISFRLRVKNMPERFIRIILVFILPVIALQSLLFQYKVEAYSHGITVLCLTAFQLMCLQQEPRENNKDKEESREQRELHENILVEMCGFFLSFRLVLVSRWLQPGRTAENMEGPFLLYVDAG